MYVSNIKFKVVYISTSLFKIDSRLILKQSTEIMSMFSIMTKIEVRAYAATNKITV